MTATSSPTDFAPATQTELARFMAENASGPRRTVCPVGGRTALHRGTSAPADVIVAMSQLTRIVDYPARDMTITVEAGLRIDELQSLLSSERQRLPIDVAQHERATLGGAIATNTSGPRRFGHGTFRDFVIGISAVNAAGQLFKAGGRVVKNVAGYDICKLLVGSHGTLGIITQVTLKLRPLPETSSFLWQSFATFEEIEQVLQRLMQSAARPVAVEVLNVAAASLICNSARCATSPSGPVLCLGVEGTAAEVNWQIDTLRQEINVFQPRSQERIAESDAGRMWEALTEFPTCADDPLTFQANLLPSRCMEFGDRATQLGVSIQAHAGNGIIIGQLPEEAATIERALAILNDLRKLAHSAKGNLVILHGDPEWMSRIPMCADPEPAWGLMQRLKRQLDPFGILNPCHFVDTSVIS